MELTTKQKVNHVIIMEDYRQGHRIREYAIEGLVDGEWKEICSGLSVGRKKIDCFSDIHHEDRKALDEFVQISGNEIHINRTAMVTEQSSSILFLTLKCDKACDGRLDFKPAMIY